MSVILVEYGKSEWRDFGRGIEKEWLLTNGIGGFASSTIICANTRRYHGLLIASMRPPVERHLVLSKIDETIILDGKKYDLFSYVTPGYINKGFLNLQRVVIDPLPVFVYNIKDVFIKKKICMVHGENTVALNYTIKNGASKASFVLTPLANFRNYHQDSKRQYMVFEQKVYESGVLVKPYKLDFDINIFCNSGKYDKFEDCWFYNMEYPVEKERGLHSTEDHYIPGQFKIELQPFEEKSIDIIATIEKRIKEYNTDKLFNKESKRIEGLCKKAGYKDEFAKKLVISADNFIVKRQSTGSKSIIAGYPWFADWGRDAMISLPGLTLATKRFDDAKNILYTFSKHVKNGLLPNMFSDEGKEPAYNNVDSSLWYFEAVYKYLKYTKDYDFIKEHIYKILKDIIRHYKEGTWFNIKMDTDCLIVSGEEKYQLTWMDAKVGDWVVTPRHGKAVEINALWYNALKIMHLLSLQFNEGSEDYIEMAKKSKDSFLKTFWNDEKKCLYDVVNGKFNDDSVRPNQIFALSLSFPVLEGEKAKCVLQKVYSNLYTDYGLRTLSQDETSYKGVCTGNQESRDSAYHQGTVWTWLIGHFITAYIRINKNQNSKNIVERFINPFKDHIKDACAGSISEIFDGDEPHIPRGCFAQAWSVAEVLRAYVEELGK